MELEALMREAFSTCIVTGGRLMFLKQYSDDEIRMIYSKFSEDLLDYNIPHYRVVGIRYPIEYDRRSVLRLHSSYGMSLIELGEKANLIIPMELGGNDKSLGCFIGENDSPNEVMQFMRDREGKKLQAFDKRYDSSEFGMIMHRCQDADGTLMYEMRSENLRYCQFSVADMVKPMLLVPDLYICTVQQNDYNADVNTTFFYKKGTGILDYSDTTKMFTRESEVFPVRTVYDLSKVFVCGYPDGSNNSLRLIYNMHVDETVLETILRQYGMEFDA